MISYKLYFQSTTSYFEVIFFKYDLFIFVIFKNVSILINLEKITPIL